MLVSSVQAVVACYVIAPPKALHFKLSCALYETLKPVHVASTSMPSSLRICMCECEIEWVLTVCDIRFDLYLGMIPPVL